MLARNKVRYDNVIVTNNLADLMAKELGQADIDMHVENIWFCLPKGRAEGASTIATDQVKVEETAVWASERA